jgi:hypothetical protein
VYDKSCISKPDVVHTYNPSTWEAKAGGSLVQGQPGLQIDTLSPKTCCISGNYWNHSINSIGIIGQAFAQI